MPRPCKRRRVCSMPGCGRFGPVGQEGEGLPAVTMTVDEYEAIRLIDLLGLTQEECAERMNVARTTAQAIYVSARKKLAECLVEGRELLIEGGQYVLCEEGERGCGCGKCHQKGRMRQNENRGNI